MKHEYLLLFDGYCNLCNSTVNRIMQYDHRKRITLAPLQSAAGKELIARYNLEQLDNQTVVFIVDGKLYLHSTAVLQVLKTLGGGWKIFYGFIIIPRPVRDYFYSIVARNRFKWFGRRKSCRVPSGDELDRFIQ